MSDLRISVVIPTCDRPDYLLEALESVSNQTFQASEVIVVDNGRSPVQKGILPAGVGQVVRGLPRFGVSQARNLGSVLTCSEYIAFLDDDDSWDPGYLQSVVETIAVTGADIVLGRLRSMNSGDPMQNKQAEFSDRVGLIEKILRRNPGAGGSNTTVAKAAFAKTSGYDPWLTTNQDKALVLDMLLAKCSVARADDAWVDVRENLVGERQTEIRKRIEGKLRFTRKYWSYMTSGDRLFNVAQVARLYLQRFSGK